MQKDNGQQWTDEDTLVFGRAVGVTFTVLMTILAVSMEPSLGRQIVAWTVALGTTFAIGIELRYRPINEL